MSPTLPLVETRMVSYAPFFFGASGSGSLGVKTFMNMGQVP